MGLLLVVYVVRNSIDGNGKDKKYQCMFFLVGVVLSQVDSEVDVWFILVNGGMVVFVNFL